MRTAARYLAINYFKKGSKVDFPEELPIIIEHMTPEEQLIIKERIKQIMDFIEELSKKERMAIKLRKEGLSYKQIAKELGIKVNTAQQLVSRGRKKLLEKLKNRGG